MKMILIIAWVLVFAMWTYPLTFNQKEHAIEAAHGAKE